MKKGGQIGGQVHFGFIALNLFESHYSKAALIAR